MFDGHACSQDTVGARKILIKRALDEANHARKTRAQSYVANNASKNKVSQQFKSLGLRHEHGEEDHRRDLVNSSNGTLPPTMRQVHDGLRRAACGMRLAAWRARHDAETSHLRHGTF